MNRRDFLTTTAALPFAAVAIPRFDDEKLASFPEGYRYLAYGQSAAYKIKLDLPQSRGASPPPWLGTSRT